MVFTALDGFFDVSVKSAALPMPSEAMKGWPRVVQSACYGGTTAALCVLWSTDLDSGVEMWTELLLCIRCARDYTYRLLSLH